VATLPPPPVIDSARVIAYAFVDDIPYRRAGALFVGDVLLEKVPCLAICTNLGEDIGPMLFHCDGEWNCLGTSGEGTVEAVKQLAERNYPGVGTRWIALNTTQDEALHYYDEQPGNFKCAFCSKRPFEIDSGWTEGADAVICHDCVESIHKSIHSEVRDA
jgi:hypothetical protein